ncbi:MAG: histone [Euryarchaeota archaeon]|nr:histone [Euryarchaeota archaeon]
MDRLIRKVGAERVGRDASTALSRVIEKKADNIARKAIALADHANRKTVRKEDIKLAAERV